MKKACQIIDIAIDFITPGAPADETPVANLRRQRA
jgi:hypothetical protein